MLRFETNKTEPGSFITLNDYIKRMKPDQKDISYFAAPTREIALASPYFEVVKKNDNEVLFLFEPYDETVMLILGQFKSKHLVGIEQEGQKDHNKDDLVIEGIYLNKPLIGIKFSSNRSSEKFCTIIFLNYF